MVRRGFAGAVLSVLGTRNHEATVTEVTRLTPSYVRIQLHSPTILDAVELGPAAWLRFWFPDLDGADRVHQRGYTIIDADPAAGTFAIDVVLHEPAGPASAWANRARTGDCISLASFGSHAFAVPGEMPTGAAPAPAPSGAAPTSVPSGAAPTSVPSGYLLIGDSASMPAISSILGAVPAEIPIVVVLEEHDETDRSIPLASHPRAEIHWVPRRGASSLAESVPDAPPGSADWSGWQVWASPEATSLRHLRTRLRRELGVRKADITARAYWTTGRMFGSSATIGSTPPA